VPASWFARSFSRGNEHALDVGLDLGFVVTDVGAHPQVLDDRHAREHAATFRDHRESVAQQLERRLAGERRAEIADLARRRLEQAGHGLERRRLAGAVRADQRDEFALVDLEIDALDRLDAAIGDLQAVDREHRLRDLRLRDGGHQCAPPAPR
jgi:hypothetical protein